MRLVIVFAAVCFSSLLSAMDDDLVLNIADDDGSSSRIAGKKGGRWTDR